MKNYFNEFSKIMHSLSRRHDLSRTFNDLLTVSLCTYHRTNIKSRLQEKDEVSEALYMQTIKPYKKDDLNNFAKALGTLHLNASCDPYSDILGEFFMQEITKGQNGQYFTPVPICDMMASIQMGNDEQEHKKVLDPACGSGRLLLSGAKHSPNNYFFGADNSNTCAKMATLNFFVNGLRGEVAWMNSLSMEFYGAWNINTDGIGIVPVEKEQSMIWFKAPKTKPDNSKIDIETEKLDDVNEQLIFF